MNQHWGGERKRRERGRQRIVDHIARNIPPAVHAQAARDIAALLDAHKALFLVMIWGGSAPVRILTRPADAEGECAWHEVAQTQSIDDLAHIIGTYAVDAWPKYAKPKQISLICDSRSIWLCPVCMDASCVLLHNRPCQKTLEIVSLASQNALSQAHVDTAAMSGNSNISHSIH